MILFPDWDRPANIHFALTNRFGGSSGAPFDSFNLATHVGDNEAYVLENRRALCRSLNFTVSPTWLDQVHGSKILRVEGKSVGVPKADGVFTRCSGVPLAIMTADCMPILVCNHEGTEIAAVHAGWRGLAAGIIKNVLNQFTSRDLLVFLGPTIDVCHYEVDETVRSHFDSRASFSQLKNSSASNSSEKEHWMFDLYDEASRQLKSFGVDQITMERNCTYCDESLFSYRRDGQTGRFASLIWMS